MASHVRWILWNLVSHCFTLAATPFRGAGAAGATGMSASSPVTALGNWKTGYLH